MRMRFLNEYQVFYVLRNNRQEQQRQHTVWAHNAKEAIKQTRIVVRNKDGKTLYRPKAIRIGDPRYAGQEIRV